LRNNPGLPETQLGYFSSSPELIDLCLAAATEALAIRVEDLDHAYRPATVSATALRALELVGETLRASIADAMDDIGRSPDPSPSRLAAPDDSPFAGEMVDISVPGYAIVYTLRERTVVFLALIPLTATGPHAAPDTAAEISRQVWDDIAANAVFGRQTRGTSRDTA
jgi:hypothetical protein